jgi:RNA polymerase sigma-70 factor (ECF subfamily)
MASEERLLMLNKPANGEETSVQPEPAEPENGRTKPGTEELLTLVEAARTGQQAAFETLMTHFQTPVRLYLAHLVGDDEQARDLTQETFWQVWKALPTLRDPTSFRSWLFRVATNRGRSWLRHRRLIGWVSLEWLSGNAAGGTNRWEDAGSAGEAFPAPESDFEERLIETDTLRQALRQVPLEYRSCLLLHLSLSFTVPEVAEQLGLTPGAVRMRLFRGLAILRKTYHQQNT